MVAGKVIMITGAGGGIGRECCLVLAAAGARLIVTDISESGEATAAAVRATGGEAKFVRADLGSESEIAALIAGAVATYGRLDGAFNNAGVEQKNKALADLSLAEWERAIRIDLTAVFLCMKYQIPAMLRNGGGAIVNTASSLGRVSIANASDYVAAKHGVIGLTRAASTDYAAKGVRVNAVLPGITSTPLILRLCDDPAFSVFLEKARERHPIGRFGEPREIGETVKWLLSDAASFVTGADIAVDGGYLSM